MLDLISTRHFLPYPTVVTFWLFATDFLFAVDSLWNQSLGDHCKNPLVE